MIVPTEDELASVPQTFRDRYAMDPERWGQAIVEHARQRQANQSPAIVPTPPQASLPPATDGETMEILSCSHRVRPAGCGCIRCDRMGRRVKPHDCLQCVRSGDNG
jgi:hypothetical protein